MKKMGLFGGSFDPIHISHIRLARQLADKLGLDGVLLMPTYVPPHKIRTDMAPAEDRLAMCRLAAEEEPLLSVSDLELSRGGASFTAETLTALVTQYPDTEWYLFTGADMFVTLRTWHRFADIAARAVLCAIPREGTDTGELARYAAALTADGCRCYVDDTPAEAISSTDIRQRVRRGEPLTGLVTPAVERYIREHRLYADPAGRLTPEEQFAAIIRARLGDRRYHHSLCVAQEAERLALKYGADPVRARRAGLLHDILKDTDPKSQLQIVAEFGILLDSVEQSVPKLWHARTGAAFIENILHIDDPAIVEAVRYHTTGRAGMSLLERVLFVADFTSADRDYPDVDEIRRRADISLEAAMEYGVIYTIRDLLERGQPVHPDTLALYNEMMIAKGGAQQ